MWSISLYRTDAAYIESALAQWRTVQGVQIMERCGMRDGKLMNEMTEVDFL